MARMQLVTETEPTVLDIESPREMALAYARHGWLVFPLHTVIDGGCDCRRPCHSPGKHPRTMKGFKDATTDLDVIDRWWSMWPAANVGIRTGMESGIVVIDIDPRNGGLETAATLPLRRTAQVLTQGDGFHLYYLYPEEGAVAGSLGAGVDVKADGGYVAAPPSVGVDGQYVWVVAEDLAPL